LMSLWIACILESGNPIMDVAAFHAGSAACSMLFSLAIRQPAHYPGFCGRMAARSSRHFPINRALERSFPRESRGHNAASSIRTRSSRPLGGLSSSIPAPLIVSIIRRNCSGVISGRIIRPAFGMWLHPERGSAA
jgi:hypothetical protein